MQESFLYKYRKTHDKIAMNVALAIYLIFALGIFIVPGDILSRCEICREFVNFMKQYFPNIQIFSDVSPFKQEIEFYTSYIWVIGLLWAAELVFYETYNTIFVDKGLSVRETVKKFNLFELMFGFGMGIFAIYVYYAGYIVTDGVTFMAWDITIDFATKFEIFQYISLFQLVFMFGIAMFIALFYTLLHKIFSKEN
ncbi:hypothetical protein [Campylobacter rectus]|uniref:hypothetical protein n=1 Tax=Campylobacter rectus TaxID=203 RepID=UPI0021AB8DFB|nr:hypothetical protein [Campylobacter rectus]